MVVRGTNEIRKRKPWSFNYIRNTAFLKSGGRYMSNLHISFYVTFLSEIFYNNLKNF